MRVLVTGGAGFIGSHLIDRLLQNPEVEGVLSYDVLDKQVHPDSPTWPSYQFESAPEAWKGDAPRAQTWFGDVRDPNALARAFESFLPDVVIHLAALVGVGQSAEWPAKYVSANTTGTSVLVETVARYNDAVAVREELERELALPPEERASSLEPSEDDVDPETAAANLAAFDAELLAKIQILPAKRIRTTIIAGSMSSYGEGGPFGVREDRALAPTSVYAWTKAAQEDIARMIAEARGLDVRIARFFNVIGPRQALTNPYTGIGAIFAARNLVGLPARIYEDGEQQRDFIDVRDVATAILAIVENGTAGEAYNVCVGSPRSVIHLAETIRAWFDGAPGPEVTGLYRAGDVRFCFGNSEKLRGLGWEPAVPFTEAVFGLVRWVRDQPESVRSRIIATTDAAHQELLDHGLLVQPGGDA